jgi:hypothetical protein
MPVKWKLFKLVCVLQLAITSFFAVNNLINLFRLNDLYYLLASVFYILVIWLSILGIGILSNNYPDVPVTGSQKRSFNWLFLLNFLLLAFFFAALIAQYYILKDFTNLTRQRLSDLPLRSFIEPVSHLLVLVFQFIILYGLYVLRRNIYTNFTRKKFEFETPR